MDTALPPKFPFILDRNFAKANCTGNQVCTSCDRVVLGQNIIYSLKFYKFCSSYICMQSAIEQRVTITSIAFRDFFSFVSKRNGGNCVQVHRLKSNLWCQVPQALEGKTASIWMGMHFILELIFFDNHSRF